MYSSSQSSASTEPIDQKWALPVPTQALKDCYLDCSYNKPIEIPDDYGLCPKIPIELPICEKKEKPKIQDYRCKENAKIITKWMAEDFSKDCRTLEDILIDESNQIKETKKFVSKLSQNRNLWSRDLCESHHEIPYIERFYCYPRIVVDLGSSFVHYKKIMEYIRAGIKVFLFDLRFTTEKMNYKNLEHIRHAKKMPNPNGGIEATIATYFLITERMLRTGLNKFNQDIFLDRDSIILLTSNRYYSNKSDHKVIYINFADYVKRIMNGDIIKIGSEIEVQVQKEYKNSLECIVIKDGLLRGTSEIKIPTLRTFNRPPHITIEEEEDIMQAFRLGCDFIVVPYPFNSHVITFIHWVTAAQHRTTRIFTRIDLQKNIKIDTEELALALEKCMGCLIYLDELLEITPILRTIFNICLRKDKFITWGGLYDKDVKSIIIPDDDEIKKYMFLYPEQIFVKSNKCDFKYELKHFITQNYPEMNRFRLQLSCNPLCKSELTIENVFMKYMITSYLKTHCSCIVVTNNSAKSVIQIAKCKPIVPIITSFCDSQTARRSGLMRNVYSLIYYNPIHCSWNTELEHRLGYCVEFGKEIGVISKHDPFIYCFDSKRGTKFSDSYRILTLDNILIN